MATNKELELAGRKFKHAAKLAKQKYDKLSKGCEWLENDRCDHPLNDPIVNYPEYMPCKFVCCPYFRN